LQTEGAVFQALTDGLRANEADDLIVIHCVAAAKSGITRHQPQIYTRDVDTQDNLIEDMLPRIDDGDILFNTQIMGQSTYEFPDALREAGFNVTQQHTCDWRGSRDEESRNPESEAYGRQGAYSGSLWQPKAAIQAFTVQAALAGRRDVVDHFFPTMRTRALGFIPGGVALANLFENLMRIRNVRHIGIPELALRMLTCIRVNVEDPSTHEPFVYHDRHEAALDPEAFDALKNLSPENYDLIMAPV
jgi:hypothetical protein